MIIIISPAKSMNFESQEYKIPAGSVPELLERTEVLARVMKKYSAKDIQDLMGVSDAIAKLNFGRFQKWDADFSSQRDVEGELSMKQAIAAFTGTVYQQFDLENWSKNDFDYANEHLRILSGFYGILRPLDFIKPYRLEMGRKVAADGYKDLYIFWKEDVAAYFDELSVTDGPIINLASNEYAKVIDRKECDAEMIDIDFKVMVNRKLVSRGFLAKAARGATAESIVRGRLNDPKELKKLKPLEFEYSSNHSTDEKFVFIKH